MAKKKKKQEKQRANAQDSAYQKPVHLLVPIRLAPLAVVHYMGVRDEITSAVLNIY